jgi:hypothetical protein
MLNFIKWIGTLCIILAAFSRSANYHTFDMVLSIIGASIWAYAAVRVKDKALLVVNVFILIILIFGIL